MKVYFLNKNQGTHIWIKQPVHGLSRPLSFNISYQKKKSPSQLWMHTLHYWTESFILLLWFSSWKIMPITDFLSGNVVSGWAPRPAVGARHRALAEVFEGRVPESVAHCGVTHTSSAN